MAELVPHEQYCRSWELYWHVVSQLISSASQSDELVECWSAYRAFQIYSELCKPKLKNFKPAVHARHSVVCTAAFFSKVQYCI